MSLLTICQNVANEVGFDAPSSIVSNTDETAQQLYRLANREGKMLSRAKNWQALIKEKTFLLATGVQTYALPTDYRWILPNTTFDRSGQRQAINPVTSEEWAFLKGWASLAGLNFRMRIRNNRIEIEQTVTASDAGKTIAYEYLSKYWAKDLNGTAKAEFTADTDESLIDEDIFELGLKWRFEKAKGFDYADSYAEYENEVRRLASRDGGARTLKLGGNNAGSQLGVNVPDRGFG